MNESQHVTESAGAYVLGALPIEEARQIEAHAQECDVCRQEIRNLREVTGVLPLATPLVQPAPDLKSKVLTAAERDVPAQHALRRAAERAALRQPRHDFWHRPIPSWAGVAGWVGVAAACIVAGIFIGVANERQRMLTASQPVSLSSLQANHVSTKAARNAASAPEPIQVFPVSADQLRAAIALIGQSEVFDLSVRHSGDHIPAKVMQMPNQNHAMLVSDMPAAPLGEVYRVWLIRKGKLHRIGVVAAGKMVKTTIPMKVEMGDVIAFSMAPIGDTALPSHFMLQQTL